MAQRHTEDTTDLDVPADIDLSPKARTLLSYLDSEINGESYLKSRFIAREIDLSAKEIGAMMARLQDEPVGWTIEKWGYTNGTTWRIRPE